jgi:hypothetical protein
MMNAFFLMGAVFKAGRSETRRILNGPQGVTGRNRRGGDPASTGSNWPAQSGRIPARGHEELLLMRSQLG